MGVYTYIAAPHVRVTGGSGAFSRVFFYFLLFLRFVSVCVTVCSGVFGVISIS